MPVTGALGAAALGGAGVQQLWQYNRENFFFDMPLKQAQVFQEQNIALSRFGLFREDVRDLTALTLDKVESYLIVNTLKLGFIVTVFFNFDRTSGEMPEMNFAEEQINVILCVTLGTSFFWLLTSVWFSMHAVILAQSLMTKMLLQVVRIPMPTNMDIMKVVPNARAFERNIFEAFRLPFFSRTATERERERERQAAAERAATHSFMSAGSENSSAWSRAPWARSALRHRGAESPAGGAADVEAAAPLAPHHGANGSSGAPSTRISITDLVEGGFCMTEAEHASAVSSVEPHVKLFKLIRASWSPYDLYGKISMELGTATMLSGFAYFSLYYFRTSEFEFRVQVGGWFTFIIMSVLSWWCLILDMELSVLGHILVAVLVHSAPVALMINYFWLDALEGAPVGVSVVFSLQALWVLSLCWSAVSVGSNWPTAWRGSYFLNVLHGEQGPAPHYPDVARKVKPGAPHYPEHTGMSNADDHSEEEWASEDSSGAHQEAAARARMLAGPMLCCLDAILAESSLTYWERRSVRRARDLLYEASRAAGAPSMAEGRNPFYVEAFWLTTGARGCQGGKGRKPCWISTTRRECIEREDGHQMPLAEILDAARHTSENLFYDSQRWTQYDMEQLSRYGGESLPGVRSFLAQFRRGGSGATRAIGEVATRTFRGGVLLISVMWGAALYWSFACSVSTMPVSNAARTPKNQTAVPDLRRRLQGVPAGTLEALEVPRWLEPLSLGCDASGSRLVLADSVGAFVVEGRAPRRLTSLRPLQACGEAEALAAADFGPGGQLWAACPDGVRLQGAAANASSPSAASGLKALALDSAPLLGGPPGLAAQALAVRGARLLALRPDPDLDWALAGTVAAPAGHRWVAAALRGGQGLVLDDRGVVFAVDTVTGRWEGPAQLDRRLQWRGLCLLPEGDWLALALPSDPLAADAGSGAGAGPQLWRFPAPGAAAGGGQAGEEEAETLR